MKPVVRRGSQAQALAPDVDFVSQDENRVVDERGGRTPMGAPIGRALADEYELEHDVGVRAFGRTALAKLVAEALA